MKKKLVNELNLKGEVCPMTFVKTKLAIESLNSGERLKVFFNSDFARYLIIHMTRKKKNGNLGY